MNYTKGEWKVGHYIIYSGVLSEQFPSLICNTDIGIVEEAEKTANAHLIAAAPEMYEALKELDSFAPLPREWRAKIEKALALAEAKTKEM